MIVTTIDPKNWIRGAPIGSTLRTPQGRMCCLGFLGMDVGISPDELTNRKIPASLDPELQRKYPLEEDEICNMMRVNDLGTVGGGRVELTDEQRVAQLNEIAPNKVQFRLLSTEEND